MDMFIDPAVALQFYTFASALKGCLCYVVPGTLPKEIENNISCLCDYFYSRCAELLPDEW